MMTLESTKQAFDRWRANKVNTNTPIPTKLWNMVDQLLQEHQKSELCKVLGISSHQIMSHCTVKTLTEDRASAPSQTIGDFVEVTSPTSIGTAELTIKGQNKILHLCLPASALHEVLPIIGALL